MKGALWPDYLSEKYDRWETHIGVVDFALAIKRLKLESMDH